MAYILAARQRDPDLCVFRPRMITVAGPGTVKAIAAAVRLATLLGVGVMVNVLVLARTPQDPRTLSYNIVKMLTATCPFVTPALMQCIVGCAGLSAHCLQLCPTVAVMHNEALLSQALLSQDMQLRAAQK